MRIDADRQPRRVVAGLFRGLAVKPRSGREVFRLAADDRDR
jgi:hypothetical protein